MKVFFVGDFSSNTGPASANRMLIEKLDKKQVLFSRQSNKILRIIEFIIKFIFASSICLCSYSKFNILSIKISKLFNKKVFYYMHGYKSYEYKINVQEKDNKKLQEIKDVESYIFDNSVKIFCVSKILMNLMKNKEKKYSEKFVYSYNPINFQKIQQLVKENNSEKDSNNIISLGGGMRQKNNLVVCEAIKQLNNEKDLNLNYTVIGLPYTDKDQILEYDFVTYYESLKHEDVIKLLSKSKIYIQNSDFETFGITLVEALLSGCNLLISRNTGVLELIDNISYNDVILNTKDIEEIKEKIIHLLSHGNSESMLKNFRFKELETEYVANNFLNQLNSYNRKEIEE